MPLTDSVASMMSMVAIGVASMIVRTVAIGSPAIMIVRTVAIGVANGAAVGGDNGAIVGGGNGAVIGDGIVRAVVCGAMALP